MTAWDQSIDRRWWRVGMRRAGLVLALGVALAAAAIGVLVAVPMRDAVDEPGWILRSARLDAAVGPSTCGTAPVPIAYEAMATWKEGVLTEDVCALGTLPADASIAVWMRVDDDTQVRLLRPQSGATSDAVPTAIAVLGVASAVCVVGGGQFAARLLARRAVLRRASWVLCPAVLLAAPHEPRRRILRSEVLPHDLRLPLTWSWPIGSELTVLVAGPVARWWAVAVTTVDEPVLARRVGRPERLAMVRRGMGRGVEARDPRPRASEVRGG